MQHTIKTVKGDVTYNDERFYVVIISDKTRIVKCKPAYDGGMVEFTDALTGKIAGCCGIHWFPLNVVDLGEFYFQGRPPVKPPYPSKDLITLDVS